MVKFIFCFFGVLFLQIGGFSQELNQKEKDLIAHVQASIINAENGVTKLKSSILRMEGMSSPKVRNLLNHLCSRPQTHYLEIGCWKGSTFISALFGNKTTVSSAVAIDNWSEFGGPKKDFLQNVKKFLGKKWYTVCDEDSFVLDVKKVCPNPVNVYFYDGGHSEKEQELAFTYYNEVFDDSFIAIVDDWNFSSVEPGTFSAFDKLGYNVLFEVVLPARWNADMENWWNGLYVAVIRKP